MNAIKEIEKCLYESYKHLYEEAIEGARWGLGCASYYRNNNRRERAIYWQNYSVRLYRQALGYKRSMRIYAN